MARSLKPLFLAFLLCIATPFAASAQLSYEGSSSIGDTLLPELAKAFQAKSGISFDKITSNSSAQGYQAVTEGKATIGGLSRLLTAEEMKTEPGNRVIGYDAVVIYVHKDIPVTSLTSEQLGNIFSGQIKNWKDVGGADVPIITVLKENATEGGTARQFCELILGGQSPATAAVILPGITECVSYVASTPNTITFASLAFDDKTARFVAIDGVLPSRDSLNKGEYPLARPYVLIYSNKPEDPNVTKFLDFALTKEGQEIVKKYVVPVMGFE